MEYVEHSMVKPQAVEKRAYQDKLIQKALTGNSLIVMPTALGKSFLGMVASAYVLEKDRGKILFLAPTKPLATQHYNNFKKIINLPDSDFALLTGTICPSKRQEIWEVSRVISATPQTIQNDIIKGNISLADVAMLVIDECHHTTKKYAYVNVAKWYMEQRKNPLILGLTASPSMEKLNELRDYLAIKHTLSRSEQDEDVLPYIQKKEMSTVYVDLPQEFKEISDILRGFSKELTDHLREKGCFRQAPRKTDVIELQGRLIRQKLFGLLLYATALLKVMHATELLETQGLSQLKLYFDKLNGGETKNAKFLMKRINRAVTLTNLLYASGKEHPKIEKLSEVIREQLAQKPDVKGLIFAHYRNSAQKIVELLEKDGIKAKRFVGQASKAGDIGLNQEEQQEMISEFREGKYNFLVCTSVHPDEYIILKSPAERINIQKIGQFVNSFLPDLPEKSLKHAKKRVFGWKALSYDGHKLGFYPVSFVHKHKIASNAVEIKLKGGAEAQITEDHSVFTFDCKGRHTAAVPKRNLFVSIANSAPNPEWLTEVDIVKEIISNASRDELEKIYCTISGLSQSKVRILTTDLHFLSTLSCEKKLFEITKSANIDPKTATLVCRRLAEKGCIYANRRGKYLHCTISKSGRKYLAFLQWYFMNVSYYKRKYRVPILKIIDAKINPSDFCKIYVESKYGKTKLPRYLQVTDELASFLGYYVSEGYAGNDRKHSRLFLSAQDKKIRNKMVKSARVLGIKLNVNGRGVALDSYLAYVLIKSVFRCGVGAHNKEVPDFIFSAPKKQKLKFLEAYFIGDGYADDIRIVLTTVSRKLATGLIFLLRQLGIKNITIAKQPVYRVNIYESLPFAKLPKKGKNTKTYYGTQPVALFSNAKYAKFGNMYYDTKKTRICKKPDGPVCFDYIQKIMPVEQPKFVYDISVKGTENFFGGPGLICLHNSVGEEGLDIPSVDLVVFYEPVPSEIRKIQREGRTGRVRAGKVIVLVTRKTRDESYYWSAIRKEKKMKQTLRNMQRPQQTLDSWG